MSGKCFEIRTTKADCIKRLIEYMKEILTETNFRITKDGIFVLDYDYTKTIIMDLRLYAKNFNKFVCNKPQTLGIEIGDFYKYIRGIESHNAVTLSMDDDNLSVLNIIIDNSRMNKKSELGYTLSDLNSKQWEINDEEFDYVLSMPSNEFHKTCRNISIHAQELTISCYKKELKFSYDSDSGEPQQITYEEIPAIDDGKTDANRSGLIFLKRSDDVIFDGKYSVEHLLSFCRFSGICNNIEIRLKLDYPLVIVYSVVDLGHLTLYLSNNEED
jgi:proliferating cell nuclear antigen